MDNKHLKKELVNKWASGLKAQKGGEKQVELLEEILKNDPKGFAKFIEDSIAGEENSPYESEGYVHNLTDERTKEEIIQLTPGHMYMMPTEDIIKLYNHWKDIPYGDAASSTFWGTVTLSLIRNGVISPIWLAVDQRCDEDMAFKDVDMALREGTAKKRDILVRRILRWMMGPGHFRGGAELYGNCSLAKAWWCGHLTSECCAQDPSISFKETVRSFKGIWLELADYLAGKLTVVSEINVVSGLALWAFEWRKANKSSILTRTQVREAIYILGEMSAWCALGLNSPQENGKLIQDQFNSREFVAESSDTEN